LIDGAGTSRSRHPAIVGAIALAILAVTLLPYRNGALSPFSFCFTCDFRWLADAVLNIGLFLPLGMALARRGRSWWIATLAGAVFSTAIELLQMVVPGRDPSLRDIVANTLGAALGAVLVYRPRVWLVPTPRQAWWLLVAAAAFVAGVVISTGVLLSPARSVTPFSVTRTETDALVQYQTRADVIGLDQPAYYVRRIFAGLDPSAPIQVDVSRRRTGLCLRTPVREACQIGPTLGRGWSALIYPAAVSHSWGDDLIDVAWTMILFFPLGFWTTRRSLIVSAAVSIGLLAVMPFAVGLVPTTVAEWVGAFAGMVVGHVAVRAVRRRLETLRSWDHRRAHP
jgi:hypothetical protein